jgi:GDP-L-fucose synthase
MKIILVTGSNGLLGSALVRVIQNNNEYRVIKHSREECNLSNRDETIEYITKQKKENNIDTVIHAAAEVGGVLKNTLYTQKMFFNNLQINNNVIEASHLAEIENFANILSTCIFSQNAHYPLTVDQLASDGLPHPSTLGYSLAKRISLLTTQSYGRVFNKNWINIIPTNIYGINDNFNLENSHVIPALIRKAHSAIINDEDFIIWSSGESYRQFIFSEDLANLILWALENWKKDIPFLAVNPTEYSIKSLVLLIANKFSISEDKIKFDLSKPGGIPRMTAVSSAEWYNFISLEDGLDKTIKWYKENYNNIRK